MMTTRDGLIAAILANPTDLAPRLAFGDYLIDDGNPVGESWIAWCRWRHESLPGLISWERGLFGDAREVVESLPCDRSRRLVAVEFGRIMEVEYPLRRDDAWPRGWTPGREWLASELLAFDAVLLPAVEQVFRTARAAAENRTAAGRVQWCSAALAADATTPPLNAAHSAVKWCGRWSAYWEPRPAGSTRPPRHPRRRAGRSAADMDKTYNHPVNSALWSMAVAVGRFFSGTDAARPAPGRVGG